MNINRLRSQRQRLENYSAKRDLSLRRARTRTLIQLGGLLHMMGLSDYVGIQQGDDLQLDLHASNKAATLLGILLEKFQELHESPSKEELLKWQTAGISYMKTHHAKSITNKTS
ncbi:MAG: conjugal transfer protein TraD [Holosporales bacterium]